MYVTRSGQLLPSHPWSTRLLYGGLLSATAAYYQATGQMAALLRKPRVHLLTLHHVFEDEEQRFRQLLRRLSREHQFISYSEAVERIWTGAIDRPYVNLSFDDGLKSCLRAAQIMGEVGATGCFFVCPPMLETTDYDKIKAFCAQKLAMPATEFLTWDDVETLRKAGHEIGGHTLTHPNLAQLSAEEVRAEVGGCREALRSRLGEAQHLAWPYGRFRHMSATAARATFEVGFRSCASVERGCHIAQTAVPEDLCLRRTTIVASRPVHRTLALVASDSRKATPSNNDWPPEWRSLTGHALTDAPGTGA